jgi:hypothetical protein
MTPARAFRCIDRVGAAAEVHHKRVVARPRLRPTSETRSLAVRSFIHSPATRGLDISGADEKVDPNVTISPIGDV